MKIEDVKLTVFRRPDPGHGRSAMIKGQSTMALLTEIVAVQITTDEGITGETFSLGGGMGMAHYLASTFKPALIGRDPAERELIWQDLWDMSRLWFPPLFALGTVDVALWDLYAKSVDSPVHEVLGTYRRKIPAYASSMTKESVGEFVEEALAYKERGYQGYKLHVWADPDRDIEACRAVRKAVGDEWPLMIDVVAGYNQHEALRVGHVLDELNFLWYEEPLRDYDIHGYRMLAENLDVAICGGETNEGGLYSRAELISSRAVDIVRGDPSFTYGIGHTRKIATLAEAFGINFEVHTNPNPMMDAAGLQVALSVKNTSFFEQLVPESLYNFGVEAPVFIDGEGFAHAPEGSGLGLKIDWDFVDHYKIAEL